MEDLTLNYQKHLEDLEYELDCSMCDSDTKFFGETIIGVLMAYTEPIENYQDYTLEKIVDMASILQDKLSNIIDTEAINVIAVEGITPKIKKKEKINMIEWDKDYSWNENAHDVIDIIDFDDVCHYSKVIEYNDKRRELFNGYNYANVFI